MPKQSVQITMDQRLGGDHFGKEHSVRGHLPQKIAAMPVSPIHHRCGTQTAVNYSAVNAVCIFIHQSFCLKLCSKTELCRCVRACK
jgi:hypothetical protein